MTEGYLVCPHCGGETPEENLDCIYCGSALPHRIGVFTKLRYGAGGVFCILVVLVIIIALLAWLLI